MDHSVFLDGSSILFDLEARLEKEKSENCGAVFSGSTRTEFFVVASFFWTEITGARINSHHRTVDFHRDDYEKIPAAVQDGFLLTRTLFTLG